VKFEWDEQKNQENIRKHGLDFADAFKMFEGPMLAALDTRTNYGEDRWIGIAFLRNIVAVVVYTERGDVVRIISLRKALKHERGRFEQILEDELGQG
jgi:uncharacterized protein